ncbi:dihydrofolate reductase [Candidatus Peregrinibacteria bacterium]|nr:dihydrofolate reductase [Candidatus Peregrinibacteria bacterium]
MNFSIIAAVDEKNGIGIKGKLPWRLSKDLAYFQDITTDSGKNAVIMGRTTWESLPKGSRPLKNRLNIVLTRNSDIQLPEGVFKADSIDAALALAKGKNAEQVFVIGGAQVYAQAIENPNCTRIYLTQVFGDFKCDTFFPKFDPTKFEKTAESELHEEADVKFVFTKYRKAR